MLHQTILVILFICLFTVAQTHNNSKIATKSPVMYQISTRPFLYELSEKQEYKNKLKTGKKHIYLKEVNDSYWKELKNKGVDIVWLMGLWKLGDYALCRGTDIKYEKKIIF